MSQGRVSEPTWIVDQQHNKYKLVESQLTRSLQSMHGKIPEI